MCLRGHPFKMTQRNSNEFHDNFSLIWCVLQVVNINEAGCTSLKPLYTTCCWNRNFCTVADIFRAPCVMLLTIGHLGHCMCENQYASEQNLCLLYPSSCLQWRHMEAKNDEPTEQPELKHMQSDSVRIIFRFFGCSLRFAKPFVAVTWHSKEGSKWQEMEQEKKSSGRLFNRTFHPASLSLLKLKGSETSLESEWKARTFNRFSERRFACVCICGFVYCKRASLQTFPTNCERNCVTSEKLWYFLKWFPKLYQIILRLNQTHKRCSKCFYTKQIYLL